MRGTLDLPGTGMRLGAPVPAGPARARAVSLRLVLRDERPAAAQAIPRRQPFAVLPAAVSVEGRRAVRADDPEVVEPVVVSYAVDMVKDQPHPPAAPGVALSAQLAPGDLHALVIEALLEAASAVRRPLDEDLFQWDAGTPPAFTGGRVLIEVVGRDAELGRSPLQRPPVAARWAVPKATKRLGPRPRPGDRDTQIAAPLVEASSTPARREVSGRNAPPRPISSG
jgi:hypothetical protein